MAIFDISDALSDSVIMALVISRVKYGPISSLQYIVRLIDIKRPAMATPGFINSTQVREQTASYLVQCVSYQMHKLQFLTVLNTEACNASHFFLTHICQNLLIYESGSH
jgi:hypothetical protein